MMSSDERHLVSSVYQSLLASEVKEWDEIDDIFDILDYLEDSELNTEARIKWLELNDGTVKCPIDHEGTECFAKKIHDAVKIIIDLYKDTRLLHKNNRYILQYYLVLAQMELVVSE